MKQFIVIQACNFFCFPKNLEICSLNSYFRFNKKVQSAELMIFKDFFKRYRIPDKGNATLPC